MANISSARGCLNFKVYAQAEDEARNFLSNLDEYLRFGEYAAFMSPYEIKVGDENGVKIYSISTDFEGCGRWVFDENIQRWFGSWSKSASTKRFVNEIERYRFDICFDFVDFECGLRTFYHEAAVVQHEAGTPLDESNIRVECVEDIDINVQNLIDNGYEGEVDYLFPEKAE